MKKIVFTLFFAGLLFASMGQARSMYWERIDVDLNINKDSSVNVTEKQEYVFSGDWNGGMRWIPLQDFDSISQVEVWEGGRKYTEGNLDKYGFKTNRKGDKLVIQWRSRRQDEPPYDYEHKIFTIKYKVDGVIKYGRKTDELYWKAIFEEREDRVEKATVTVRFPQVVEDEQIRVRLYSGAEAAFWQRLSPNEIYFEGKDLDPERLFEVKIAFPTGIVEHRPLSFAGFIKRRLVPMLSIMMGFITTLIMLGIYQKRGQDYKVIDKTVSLSQPPSALPPAIAGALIDEKVDKKELTATIIDLARRGYLKIFEKVQMKWVFTKREYEIKLLKEPDDTLSNYEKKLIDTLFFIPNVGDKVKIEERRDDLAENFNELQDQIFSRAIRLKYFEGDPREIINKYLIAGNVILIVGMLIMMFSDFGVSPLIMIVLYLLGLAVSAFRIRSWFDLYATIVMYIPLIIVYYFMLPALSHLTAVVYKLPEQIGFGLVLSGLVIDLFSSWMPRKTLLGSGEKEKWQKFKHYLEEIYKPGDKIEAKRIFNEYLPYAVAFGVSKKWLSRFFDQAVSVPDWYHSSFIDSGGNVLHSSSPEVFSGGKSGGAGEGRGFTVDHMSVGFDSMLSHLSNSFTPTMSFDTSEAGGGGGSGGGGGGGW